MTPKNWLTHPGRANGDNPFDRSGLASVQDLDPQYWEPLFAQLETIQDEFLATAPHSATYSYPKDSLHTWSRVWEYPYVYHHIRHWRETFSSKALPTVLDFGSGVTFFPFAVARLGCHVVCGDIDAACEADINRAASRLSGGPGQVAFRLFDGSRLPFTSGTIDVIYSISVLEHLPEPASLLPELWRVLAPGGVLILTFDIDLESHSEVGLGPQRYCELVHSLTERFDLAQPRTEVHPASLLTTTRGPFPLYARPPCGLRYWREARYYLKQYVLKPLLGKHPATRWKLACHGMVLKVRARL